MTYRFKLQEPVAQGVRRIGLEQIDIAVAKLGGKDDIPAGIHDARRCLKRLRALLRLIRPGLADAIYGREIERLVGTGKLLSGARDLFVMQQTLAKLENRFGALPNGAGERLRKVLANGHARSRRASIAARRQAMQRLDQAKRLFIGKAADGIEFEHVADGLQADYRKARKAFHHAYRDANDEAFHAWRKKVQLHWRHMSLLSRGWPDALSARASEAKELSRLLGEDHDYAVLLAFAGTPGASRLGSGNLATLVDRCRTCQEGLRAQAKPRGDRLFAERAHDLTERVTLYWTSAARLAALTPADAPSPTSRGPRQPEPGKKVGRILDGD